MSHGVRFDRSGRFTEQFPLRQAMCHAIAFFTNEPQRFVVPVSSPVVGNKLCCRSGMIHVRSSSNFQKELETLFIQSVICQQS